jgi:hypothetical protein
MRWILYLSSEASNNEAHPFVYLAFIFFLLPRAISLQRAAKYTSKTRLECRSTEAEYERIARQNPATVFLRCFEEYENAELLFGQANIQNFPTFDVFYGGNRVARVEGSSVSELEDVLSMFQLMNSDLDLFSEEASQKRATQWGDGSSTDVNKTPRTTARFIPGYGTSTS